ncbi:MAG TPA: hypothetical protein VH309_11685, partial [Elusimicrobiota bacterium]|nr:hypothetical protein [Elusimicrobiota bacterium]
AEKKARTFVEANLRPEAQKGYQALVDAGQFDKIEDYLTNVKPYSGDEVLLTKVEHDALAAVLQTAGHSDFTYPNAMQQYDYEMRSIMDPATHLPLVSAHVLAHQITVKFRAMVPAKPGPQDPNAPPAMLSDADLAKLSPADQAAYKKEWAAAKTDDDRRAVNKKYLDKIAALKPGGGTGGPSTPFDPSSIKTLDDLKRHTPAEQKQFCSALSSNAGAAGNCGDILANADAATLKCNSMTGTDQTATLKARNDCMAKINACKPQAGGQTSGIPSASLPKDLRDYCATLLANDNQADPDHKIGTGGSSAIDGNPCPGSSAKGATDGTTGAAAPGKDADPCKKPDDKKPDPNFYTNLGNGLSFGIGGLLLASFIGGPLLMLAVGVAAGVAGYYVSKNITEPPKDKKGGS